jgi:nitric oxide reductase NorD protein
MDSIDRHRFLASAIVGRATPVRESDKESALAFSDGRSIFLPKSPAADQEIWPAIAAQAVLIAAGSLHASLLRQLVGRRPLAQRYVYLEVLRASHVLRDRLPLAYSARSELAIAPRTESAAASLALASSRAPLPQAPPYFGTVRPLLTLRQAIGERGLAALVTQPPLESPAGVPELDEEDDGEESAILRLLQNPFSAASPLGGLLNGILGAGRKRNERAGGAASAGSEIPVGRTERALRRGAHAVLSQSMAPDLDDMAASGALMYPEWNVNTRRYAHDWVSLEQVEAERAEGETRRELTFAHPSLELRRQLARLGLDRQLQTGQSDGSDLDMRPLIDCAIDLRAGHSPSSLNVYRASLRTRRDLAVNVVLDISGSTGEQRPDGHCAFEDQLQLAYQLGSTLDSLGDTVAMMGFHSWGRGLARAVHIKHHDERWSLAVVERLRLLDPVGYTRLGAAIRHGHRVLHERIRLPNRLLILITDGVAYDQDYEQQYAAADARRALEEARSAGTACVALSVGAGANADDLTKVFGATTILVIDEVSQLGRHIRHVCRHALATVSQRRFNNRLAKIVR